MKSSKFFLLFLVAVAVFGLALVPLLLLQPNLQSDQSSLPATSRKRCILSYLHWRCSCSVLSWQMSLDVPKTERSLPILTKSLLQLFRLKGTIQTVKTSQLIGSQYRGSVFCAACSGLLIGAIAAIVGIALFSLGFFDLGTGSLWVLAAGEVLMIVGLAQIKMSGLLQNGGECSVCGWVIFNFG